MLISRNGTLAILYKQTIVIRANVAASSPRTINNLCGLEWIAIDEVKVYELGCAPSIHPVLIKPCNFNEGPLDYHINYFVIAKSVSTKRVVCAKKVETRQKACSFNGLKTDSALFNKFGINKYVWDTNDSLPDVYNIHKNVFISLFIRFHHDIQFKIWYTLVGFG